jgi:hypothetical protein
MRRNVFQSLGEDALLRVNGRLRFGRFFASRRGLRALQADLSGRRGRLEALAVCNGEGGGADDATLAAKDSGKARRTAHEASGRHDTKSRCAPPVQTFISATWMWAT